MNGSKSTHVGLCAGGSQADLEWHYTVWQGSRYTLFTLQTEAKRSEAERSGANRTAESTPFTLAQNAQQCAFHNSILFTLHTVECGSFHTGSEAKRSALFSVVMGSAILFNAVSRPICLWGRLTFTTFICMSLLYIFIIP